MTIEPELSFVLCTRNRAQQVSACLNYVAEQKTHHSFELVVVDNGSTDDTATILADYAAKALLPTVILYEGTTGVSRAKNVGWKAARGDIIAFIDDDCYPAPDYIDRLLDAFKDPRIGFAGGRVDLYDRDDYPITIWTSNDATSIGAHRYVPPGLIPGVMGVRRRVLESIGGYDVDFGPGGRFHSAEDSDLQARACFAGWCGLYVPEAVVAHHHQRKAKDVPALLRSYSMGTGAYRVKFLLVPATRFVYLQAWYWTLLSVAAGKYSLRNFLWEINGAARYLLYRFRLRLFAPRHI